MYRLLDLFSGIGGFSLGLERSGGFKTVAFCEIEEFPRRVLKKHWPKVPIYNDIRELTAERLAADGITIDAICGGFPCQDLSVAGKGAGLDGERSGLWKEYARLVGELRPKYVIVENVAALLGRGLGRVLGDLATLGYGCEWHCIPASAVGAPHRRDRVWIVANSKLRRLQERRRVGEIGEIGERRDRILSNVKSRSKQQTHEVLANSSSKGLGRQWQITGRIGQKLYDLINNSGWLPEPDVGRVANGVPHRVDRIKSLGNAVVPQIPEIIGRAIIEAE